MLSRRIIFLASLLLAQLSYGQETVTLSSRLFEHHQQIRLAPLDGWLFHEGNDSSWADPDADTNDWKKFKPLELSTTLEDEDGRVEGWFRLRVKLDSSLANIPLGISRQLWSATDVFIDGKLIQSYGNTGDPFEAYNPVLKEAIPVTLVPNVEYLVAVHFVDYETAFTNRHNRLWATNLFKLLNLTGPDYNEFVKYQTKSTYIYTSVWVSVASLLMVLFWFLLYLNPNQRLFLLIAILTTLDLNIILSYNLGNFIELSSVSDKVRDVFWDFTGPMLSSFTLIIVEYVLRKKISTITKVTTLLLPFVSVVAHLYDISWPFGITNSIMLGRFLYLVNVHRKSMAPAQWSVIAAMAIPTIGVIAFTVVHKYDFELFLTYEKPLFSLLTLGAPLMLLIYIAVRFKEILKEVEAEARKVISVTEEKKVLLTSQNEMLEKQVAERTIELKTSLDTLKSTQSQLIQSEKMASLGELTAGIAHEIQNPLNFVNNFSEVNSELISEMKEALAKGNVDEARSIAATLEENESKIVSHGKRADAIVKGMLQHSRTSSGKKEPTDINALCDEYLRLSYHGLRAKDKSFNAKFESNFDPQLEKTLVVPQDIGRVILNLINNAFYAVTEKRSAFAKVSSSTEATADKEIQSAYEPTVTVSTWRDNGMVAISVKDNGVGIPQKALDKIFQPFFTTKPTGQGTGLGLSLSYDIVKAHGGELKVETKEGEGSEFVIVLPV